MAKIPVVGRLTSQGWALTPEDKIAAVFKNYQNAAESSSTLFRGNVLSLAYAQHSCSDDPDMMATVIKRDLTTLLGNVFPEGVSIETNAVYNDDKTRFDLEIVGTVIDKQVTYNVSRYIATTPIEE